MVYHREYLTRSTLYLWDILSTRSVYNAQTRLKTLFFWTSFAGSCDGHHGDIDCLPRTLHSHTEYRSNSISDNITHSLYTHNETRYFTEIPLSPPSRLSRVAWNIRWRCIGNMTRTNSYRAQLYRRLHHTVAHTPLCSSLICHRYF